VSGGPPAFSLDGRDVLEGEPRALSDEGAVFAMVGARPRDERNEPLLTVAWLDEPPHTTLEDVVEDDLVGVLGHPGSVLVDRETTHLGGVDCVRTFVLHLAAGGLATASEQWRLLAGGRRWTVTAMTALADQPAWGPELAAIAATFRVG
jgi:hypothetical protein